MEEKEYKKQIWKPSVLTSPVPPVLVTCGTGEVRTLGKVLIGR